MVRYDEGCHDCCLRAVRLEWLLLGCTFRMASSGNGSIAVCEISIYVDANRLSIYAEAESGASQTKKCRDESGGMHARNGEVGACRHLRVSYHGLKCRVFVPSEGTDGSVSRFRSAASLLISEGEKGSGSSVIISLIDICVSLLISDSVRTGLGFGG